jgi:hypothetical protein
MAALAVVGIVIVDLPGPLGLAVIAALAVLMVWPGRCPRLGPFTRVLMGLWIAAAAMALAAATVEAPGHRIVVPSVALVQVIGVVAGFPLVRLRSRSDDNPGKRLDRQLESIR